MCPESLQPLLALSQWDKRETQQGFPFPDAVECLKEGFGQRHCSDISQLSYPTMATFHFSQSPLSLSLPTPTPFLTAFRTFPQSSYYPAQIQDFQKEVINFPPGSSSPFKFPSLAGTPVQADTKPSEEKILEFTKQKFKI